MFESQFPTVKVAEPVQPALRAPLSCGVATAVVVSVTDADFSQPSLLLTLPVNVVVSVIGPTVKSWHGPAPVKVCVCPPPVNVKRNGPKLAPSVVHTRTVVVAPHCTEQLV